MIQAQHIFKSFDNHTVLTDISADFYAGENNLIIGMSGSGKTVLMKCLVGLLSPEQGQVFYNQRNYIAMTHVERTAIRREVGMVFQGGALFDSLSVLENVAFPLDMYTNWSVEQKHERARFCLDRVDLPHASKLYPSELSGGMKKRVAIARAIALQPKYLFCDEPNSGLDPQTSALIDNLIDEITKEYQMTTVINTHDMNSVLGIGDRVNFIHQGHLWWKGDKHSIATTENAELIHFLDSSELTKRIRL